MGNKILIMEDSERWRQMLQTVFAGRGYEVHTACSPEEGWAQAKTTKPDVIIIDIIMPDDPRGGLKFAQRLADDKLTGSIPRLFLTVLGTDFMENESRSVAQGVFTKPFDLPHLLARVDDLLREKGERHE